METVMETEGRGERRMPQDRTPLGTSSGVAKSLAFQRLGGSSRQPVKVHIDELVLHGFAPGDRHRIAQAVESELARLLREGAPLASVPFAVTRIDAGAFHTKVGSRPHTAGTQIAQAVYRSLRQRTRASAGLRPAAPSVGGASG